MFLLVPAYPGCPGSKAVKRSLLLLSEMKGLRKILWVSWAAKKTNEWVLNKARKLAYYGHTSGNKGVAWRKR